MEFIGTFLVASIVVKFELCNSIFVLNFVILIGVEREVQIYQQQSYRTERCH